MVSDDGGFALAGFTWSTGAGLSDFWLLKADSEGGLEWQRSFGGVPRDAAHSLVQTSDGGVCAGGLVGVVFGRRPALGGQDRRVGDASMEQRASLEDGWRRFRVHIGRR